MRIKFRKIKDVVTVPIHLALRATEKSPALQRLFFGGMGLAAKAYYFTPASHVRRTTQDLCRLGGHEQPRDVYFSLIDKAMCAGTLYGELMRHGPQAVAQHVQFDEHALAVCERAKAESGCAIFVVPHCAGSVLSAAGFARRFPSVVLVRESKSPRRSEIMKQYFHRLGAELLFVRGTEPTTVARAILRALHEKKFIIGTTDLLRKKDDTVEVEVFGQKVWMPAWPARFAARRRVPIVPGFIRMDGDQIVLASGDAYMADSDLAASTQRWASYFEQGFRQHPSDWLFMYEKRWAAVIRKAAR